MKNISASVKARLNNISKEEGKTFNFILMLYMIERLIYRLSISKFKENFILKGGLFLYIKMKEKSRPTKDIDFLASQINNDMEYMYKVMEDICNIEEQDGLVFDTKTITIERIKEDQEYEGIRLRIKCYLGKAFKVIQLDIGFGDVVVPNPTFIEYPALLDMPEPKVKAYSLESVISEKFNAMIDLSYLNSRMKDFYDVYKLAENFSFDGEILSKAILKTFIARKTPLRENPDVFLEVFRTSNDKQIQWKAFNSRITEAPKDFAFLMNNITNFLEPLYCAILKDETFLKKWNPENMKWN